jgi:hypothetical protein|tara:strand:- start:396 stop:788 length:393 start_codon:yes stop_codon:yes gene_type:complete
MKISTEISVGELLDKITILEIKLEMIDDQSKRKEIQKEYDILKKIQISTVKLEGEIDKLYRSLKEINMTMWNIEDQVRICEKEKDFSDKFIQLARGVYFNNDKRSRIKLDINKKLNSNITEIKHYVDYEN